MDPVGAASLIGAITTALATLIGGSIMYLDKRSDKKRAEEKAARQEQEAETDKANSRYLRLRGIAEGYRLQLVQHDIEPIPYDWPEGI